MSGFLDKGRLSERGAVTTGLVVLNFGGPQKQEEVESFLFELFADPDVIKLPIGGPRAQRLFAERLSRSRAPKVAAQYEKIGYSPLVPTTRRQVDALKRALGERLGERAPKIYTGMRYTRPTMAEAVAEIARDRPGRLVALALYPHYSGTTTGSSFNAFSAELSRAGLGRLPVRYIPAFYDHPRYLDAMQKGIEEAFTRTRDRNEAHLLFSAHGLPSAYFRAGDPYPTQIQETVRFLVRRLDWRGPHSLSFQSRVGPARWLEPSTETEIRRVIATGKKEIVIVPVSFVSDHIETLYEIDVTFQEAAEAAGGKLIRTRALDEHPDFIDCLAEVVAKALEDDRWQGLGEHRCVRCLLPKPHEHRMKVQCMDCGFRTPEYLLRLPPVHD
ncbi:MAG: ferrochelatase [Deltaproteobacteria bacterium]|nr:ferrochelatase [Deltaproteobacteria bacterium]